MALRCTQIISGRLIAIQRQPSQFTNCFRILSVVPVYSPNKQRHFHNWNHKSNVHKSINSSNIFQLIAIGCASIIVYNCQRWVQWIVILFKINDWYWFLQNSIYEYLIPTVNADAGTEPKNTNSTVDEDTSDDEGMTDDQQAKKKSKKEKIGFRDRKVKALPKFHRNHGDQIVALCSLLNKWFRLFYTREFFFNFIFMFSMSTTLNNRFR